MKHSLVVISILSILALLASAFAAPHPMTGKIRPGEPHPFYFCESNDNAGTAMVNSPPRTYYISQVVQPDVYRVTVQQEWSKFTEGKYGVPQNMGSCTISPDKQEAERFRAAEKEKLTRPAPAQFSVKPTPNRLIEVNWTSFPGSGQ